MRRSSWLLLLTSLAGCFSRLHGSANDLSAPDERSDLGPSHDLRGASPTDLAPVDLQASDKTCALPHIQILVRDGRSTSGLQKHGSVLRVPLDGRPPCAPLTLAESLDADNSALGFWPPTATTIYGETDGRLRFIAPDDTEVQAPYNPGSTQTPDYVFAVDDATGTSRIAVAYDGSNGTALLLPHVARVDVLDPVDWSVRTHRWTIGPDVDDRLRLQQVVGLAADPRDATRFVALQFISSTYPTETIAAPFDDVTKTATAWVDHLDDDGRPKRLRAWQRRAAWIFEGPSFDPGRDDTVVHRTEPVSGAPLQWGPLTCADRLLCSAPLHLYDAIPDPTDADSILALCAVYDSPVTKADTSHLIRIKSDGACETLFRGDTLPESHYLIHLVAAVDPP